MDNKPLNEQPDNKLTEKIIGLMFKVYNNLGYGLAEKIYQRAFEEESSENKIKYSREKYGLIKYKDRIVGKYFVDFVVENKVAIELKVRNEIYQTHINQLLNYIKAENIKVGLLLAVSKSGVLIKRLMN